MKEDDEEEVEVLENRLNLLFIIGNLLVIVIGFIEYLATLLACLPSVESIVRIVLEDEEIRL